MSAGVVAKASGDHGHVWLRLGFFIEGHRQLCTHVPACPKGHTQSLVHGPDRRAVTASLRLGDDELTTNQLDRITGAEETALDQSVVLHALPPASFSLTLTHAPSLASERRRGNVQRS